MPAFWQRYLDVLRPLPRETPVAEIPFVVFDTETTGLNIRRDRMLSLGAVKVINWEMDLSKTLDLYIKQEAVSEPSAVEVHGILPVEREGSLEEEEAVLRFVDFTGNAVLAGHHISFDLAMVNAVLKRLTGGKLKNASIDTMLLARRLLHPSINPGAGTLSLDHLCRCYRIPADDRHTAAGDAYLTALLLMKLLARLEERGVRTLGDLLKKNATF